MIEEHDADHKDYDREDLEHVENLLYANIHYNTGCEENQYASTNPSTSFTEADQATGSNTPNDVNRRNSAPRRNAKRYWTNNTSNNSPNFVPHFKEKQSGFYKAAKIINSQLNNSATENVKNNEHHEPVAVTPKQFTPYVSFLPINESAAIVDDPMPVATTSKANDMKFVKTNNDLIRKTLTVKHINPFSKKHTTDTYKQLLSENALDISISKTLDNKKRLNPFNALSRKAKRKKSENGQMKSVRKNREELKQIAASENVIDIEKDGDDDDDVIILPVEAPPLICVDSSDDETRAVEEHEFTEPTAITDNRRKPIRCPSPSSSIQSADDFIAQNDQRTFGFDTFGTLSDEDLCHVGETVENQIRDTNAPSDPDARATIPNNNDNALFTPPKQMHKDKTKAATKLSYEVGANSFAAVDVYESESSDMPDSVYGKGGPRKRKNMSDSDTSSMESQTIAKSKRLRKRKSSGSAKESDHIHSDDSSSDLPDVDDDTDDDDEPNENSYLVRGEALGKIKNANNKKKSNKTASDKRSEDDFINKLSSIVHGQNDSDENDEPDSPRGSAESVEARDIVETVLQRRTKKSKKNSNTNAETIETENIESNNWSITDQIGETDELNLGRIFDEQELAADDCETQNDDEKSENQSPSRENESIDNELNQQNSLMKENKQREKSNQPIPIEANKESDETNAIDVIDAANDLANPEIGWNEEMRRFYHESWGGETFSVKNIRARMPRGFLNWMIINEDKYPAVNNSQRGRKYRCLNCQEKGHLARNCPKPPAKKHCHRCGIEGHISPKCPNTICLICGRKTRRFLNGCDDCLRERHMVCHNCKQKGHRQSSCPDRWRQYHSTINSKTPLVREPKMPKRLQRNMYCYICARAGHYGDQCNVRKSNHLSTRIFNYRSCLSASNKNHDKPIKFTILSSDIDNYQFNFGNEVSRTGNTIYARFDRATNKNQHNRSTMSDNDVAFVCESNLNDTSDPPIEIYDDFDFVDELDDVSSTDQFSEYTQDDNNITINSFQESNNSKENDELVGELAKKEAQIKQLDNKIETLEELKEKMLSHQQLNETNESNANTDQDTTPESDQIASESERIAPKDDITTSTVLPDFIPLNSDEPEKYGPARSPSPVSADSTTANENSDATIHLMKHHCKHLLTERGNRFLRESESTWNVSVRLEWRDFGNILIVNGIASNQQSFHNDLKAFFDSFEIQNQPAKLSVSQSLPKNRDALIKYIRNQIAILDSPLCNAKHLVDVPNIFRRIRFQEKNPSKANLKKNVNLRKQLNMVLFGRFGLSDGKIHLNALQDGLRRLINYNSMNVPMEMRLEIGKHIDYIFSGNDHTNYENVIDHFMQLKRDNRLPALDVDRKLLGLKINVLPQNDGADVGRKNQFRNSYPPSLPSCSRDPMPMNANDSQTNQHNNRMNTTPSSNDIQINVSTPSTSNSNIGQNEWIRNSWTFTK